MCVCVCVSICLYTHLERERERERNRESEIDPLQKKRQQNRTIIHFKRIFHEINHPATGVPHLWQPPSRYESACASSANSSSWSRCTCVSQPVRLDQRLQWIRKSKAFDPQKVGWKSMKIQLKWLYHVYLKMRQPPKWFAIIIFSMRTCNDWGVGLPIFREIQMEMDGEVLYVLLPRWYII